MKLVNSQLDMFHQQYRNGDTSNIVSATDMETGDRVVNTLTNNWAGAQGQQRQGILAASIIRTTLTLSYLGVLPPITHKISSVVDRFPVIPPITANRESSRSSGRSSVSAGEMSSHDNSNAGARRGSHADNNIKSRNRHLLKVYMVSLLQLLFVLAIVVCFTGVKSVREVHQQNPTIGVLAIGRRLVTMVKSNQMISIF